MAEKACCGVPCKCSGQRGDRGPFGSIGPKVRGRRPFLTPQAPVLESVIPLAGGGEGGRRGPQGVGQRVGGLDSGPNVCSLPQPPGEGVSLFPDPLALPVTKEC